MTLKPPCYSWRFSTFETSISLSGRRVNCKTIDNVYHIWYITTLSVEIQGNVIHKLLSCRMSHLLFSILQCNIASLGSYSQGYSGSYHILSYHTISRQWLPNKWKRSPVTLPVLFAWSCTRIPNIFHVIIRTVKSV